MKNYQKILTFLPLTVCLSVSLYATDNTLIDINLVGSPQTTLFPQSLPEEDNTVFFPTEESRQELLEKEELPINHRIMQSFGGEEVSPEFGLALDGGGFRGYMEAIWVEKLQEELENQGFNEPLYKVFNYIGGTSIGGILALGVAKGIEPNELVKLFEEHGKSIFPERIGWKVKLKTLWGLIGSRYEPESLEKLLKDKFRENTLLEDVSTNVLVTSCTTQGKPKLFKSRSDKDKKHKLWEIGLCTSAAPTYYPAHKLSTNTESYVDGGVWNNNPTALLTANMVKELHDGKFSPTNLYVLSLGTGDMSLQTRLSDNSGYISVGDIIDLLMSSSSRGTHETMQSFLGNTYYRVNPLITQKIDLAATDNQTKRILKASAEHDLPIGIIKEFANKFIDLKRSRA